MSLKQGLLQSKILTSAEAASASGFGSRAMLFGVDIAGMSSFGLPSGLQVHESEYLEVHG